jgi:peptidoglycan/LPS O-acetylase OafA/YrhL
MNSRPPMAGRTDVRQSRTRLLSYAAVTIGVVGLAVLALDDITTDNAASFFAERTALALCAGWFGLVAWRLVHDRHRIVGGLSFVLLALAVLVQPVVGPGMHPTHFGYLATVGTLAWFVAVAAILALWAWRRADGYAA